MTVLTSLADQYVQGRRKRGEITAVSARSIEARLRSLTRSFGDRPLDQLGEKAIERWQESIGHMTPGARASYLSAVRVFCRWLVDQGHVRVDPTAKAPRVVQPRRVPRAIPAVDVAALLAVAPDARARVILWLMVGCGLRCAEVARLAVSDYDARARTLEVKGKGGHERVLPVPDEVAAAIAAYGAQSHGPLIRSYRKPSRGLGANTITRYVAGWFELAGLKHRPWDGRSAHALRHTAASDVLDKSGDVRVVQAMLGHANVATTSIYLRRANLGQLREAMAGRDYRPLAA